MATREYHVFPTIQAYGACGLKYEKELFDTFFFSELYFRIFTVDYLHFWGVSHIVCIGVSTPPPKKKSPCSSPSPPPSPLNLQTAQAPPF